MILYPFPYFRNFVYGTPVIPDIYWNAYSYEERIKKLCIEYNKLIEFVDSMVDTVNAQYAEIENINDHVEQIINQAIDDGAFDTIISDAVQAWLDARSVGTTYGELKNNGFIY